MNIRYRGRLVPDSEGDELPVEEAVHDHALAIARDLVFGARMDAIRSWFDCSFEITDKTGRIVLVLPFDAVLGEPDFGSA